MSYRDEKPGRRTHVTTIFKTQDYEQEKKPRLNNESGLESWVQE